MAFILKGTVHGEKEVLRGLNRAPWIFFYHIRKWLVDEKAKFVGGKDSQNRKKQGKYNKLLSHKKRLKREGKWSSKVSGLFRGVVPYVNTIQKLKLTMGILGHHQLERAMELLATGGTIHGGGSQMPVPVYKNLKRVYSGKMSMGNVHTGLKSAAFRRIASERGLVGIKEGGKVYYFDKTQKTKGGKKFLKKGLLFVGVQGVRVGAQLTGKYDFDAQWAAQENVAINRGQAAVDRATTKADKV